MLHIHAHLMHHEIDSNLIGMCKQLRTLHIELNLEYEYAPVPDWIAFISSIRSPELHNISFFLLFTSFERLMTFKCGSVDNALDARDQKVDEVVISLVPTREIRVGIENIVHYARGGMPKACARGVLKIIYLPGESAA